MENSFGVIWEFSFIKHILLRQTLQNRTSPFFTHIHSGTRMHSTQMWTGKGNINSQDGQLDKGVRMKRVFFKLFTILRFLIKYFKLDNKLFTIALVMVFYFLMLKNDNANIT